MTGPTPRPVPPPPDEPPGGADYEWRLLTLPRGTPRSDVRRMLAEQAEYGHWELARVQLMMTGVRRVWLRRRIIRVVRTV